MGPLIITGEKQFRCKKCGMMFLGSGDHGEKWEVHTGEKQFLCPRCGKKFSGSHDMKKHERTHNWQSFMKGHSGEKVFKSTKWASQSQVTWRKQMNPQLVKFLEGTHTGEKAFKCTKCDNFASRILWMLKFKNLIKSLKHIPRWIMHYFRLWSDKKITADTF